MTFTLKNLLTIIWIKINALIIAMETITASLYPMRSNRMVLRSAVNIDRAINPVLETMLQRPILKMELAQVLCYSSDSENAKFNGKSQCNSYISLTLYFCNENGQNLRYTQRYNSANHKDGSVKRAWVCLIAGKSFNAILDVICRMDYFNMLMLLLVQIEIVAAHRVQIAKLQCLV